jgi:hypothetical protein
MAGYATPPRDHITLRESSRALTVEARLRIHAAASPDDLLLVHTHHCRVRPWLRLRRCRSTWPSRHARLRSAWAGGVDNGSSSTASAARPTGGFVRGDASYCSWCAAAACLTVTTRRARHQNQILDCLADVCCRQSTSSRQRWRRYRSGIRGVNDRPPFMPTLISVTPSGPWMLPYAHI